MAVELRIDPVNPDEKETVRNLLQLYQYDFSEFAEGVVLAAFKAEVPAISMQRQSALLK